MTNSITAPPESALRDERGSVLVVAVLVMTMMLVLTGAAFSVTQQLSGSVKKTTESQQAFAAAQAGIDRALTRINFYKPTAAQSITNVVAAPAADGWCAAPPAEALGRGSSFTYRVSQSASPVAACGGVTLSGASGDRCVVATGTVNGIVRRVATRLAISSNAATFSSSIGVVGYKQVTIKKRASLSAGIATNGKLKVEPAAVLTGTVTLGPKAKVKGYTGAFTRNATPFVPTLPNFSVFDPASGVPRDSAIVNNNLTAAANVKVVYNATTRELTVPAGVALTLPAGVYNFCKLTLGKGASINVVKPAVGATVPADAVRIFIDGRDRAGSRCTINGGLDSQTGSSFVNGSSDPRTLQIFAWGKRTKLKVGNTKDFAGLIYAPRSQVKFNNKGRLTGGVAGEKVEIRKEMKVVNPGLLETWMAPASDVTQVVSWRQCPGVGGTSPHDRCPTS